MSLWEHNAKNVIKKPLTIHALQISLIKTTAYCCGERKIKYRATANTFLRRVGEVAKAKTFSDVLGGCQGGSGSVRTPGSRGELWVYGWLLSTESGIR